MELNRLVGVAIAFASLFGVSCNKEAGVDTAGSAAKPADACTPEHLKVEKHKFCIKLGPDWQYDPKGEETRDGTTEVRLRVDKPPYPSLWVKVHTTLEMVTAETIGGTVGKGADSQVTSGEFLDGKGRWILVKSEGGKVSTYNVYVKGAGNLVYSCGASGPTPPSGTPDALEQCKTIVPLI